jgi:hypothetical protein
VPGGSPSPGRAGWERAWSSGPRCPPPGSRPQSAGGQHGAGTPGSARPPASEAGVRGSPLPRAPEPRVRSPCPSCPPVSSKATSQDARHPCDGPWPLCGLSTAWDARAPTVPPPRGALPGRGGVGWPGALSPGKATLGPGVPCCRLSGDQSSVTYRMLEGR